MNLGRRKEKKRCIAMKGPERGRVEREGRQMTDMEKKVERREDEEGKNRFGRKRKERMREKITEEGKKY